MRNCPKDDFTLAPDTYEGVKIDRCPHCRGVWLDAGELDTIQDNQTSDFRDISDSDLDGVAAAYGMAKAESETHLGCVICKEMMEKTEWGFASQVIIDRCPKGHGIWLDEHELARLEQFYEETQDEAAGELDDILKSVKGAGITGFFRRLIS